MAATYLDDIVAAHRAAACADRRDVDELVASALSSRSALHAPRGFARALARRAGAGRLGVVAEIKRRSPSKGVLVPELDAASVAAEYEHGGASCLSVLTDASFFGGSGADLVAARRSVSLPVLRKDFTVSPADIVDARAMGADAVLLIVAALGSDELREFVALAGRLGLDALVEVHDERELARAVEAGASLVGVNQRDLTTFEVDPERALRVARHLPAGMLAVAESGIAGAAEAACIAAAGFDAVLVGESLVRAADRVAATAALSAVRTSPRPSGAVAATGHRLMALRGHGGGPGAARGPGPDGAGPRRPVAPGELSGAP
ncbi:MAG: indole-3-glycerol phosphate synthase TrpC [Actinomycetota bacterium]|nr:indole-3-glycerol phosphate synthase TrpC [Actinomycetota bacterium]